MIKLDIGIRTVNEANAHEHWRKRYARTRAQRHAVALALARHRPPTPPVRVTLQRIAPRAMDSDNAIIALKTVRDAIAAWLGVDDGPHDTRAAWHYEPQGKAKDYAVRIEIEPAATAGSRAEPASKLSQPGARDSEGRPAGKLSRGILGVMSMDDEKSQPSPDLPAHARATVIAIKPVYAGRIFAGSKRVELRRRRLKCAAGERLWVYESGPVCALAGWLEVVTVHVGTPEEIWARWSEVAGVDRAAYDAYFAGASVAYAIEVGRAERIEAVPLATLRERGGFVAPQSWARADIGRLLGMSEESIAESSAPRLPRRSCCPRPPT